MVPAFLRDFFFEQPCSSGDGSGSCGAGSSSCSQTASSPPGSSSSSAVGAPPLPLPREPAQGQWQRNDLPSASSSASSSGSGTAALPSRGGRSSTRCQSPATTGAGSDGKKKKGGSSKAHRLKARLAGKLRQLFGGKAGKRGLGAPAAPGAAPQAPPSKPSKAQRRAAKRCKAGSSGTQKQAQQLEALVDTVAGEAAALQRQLAVLSLAPAGSASGEAGQRVAAPVPDATPDAAAPTTTAQLAALSARLTELTLCLQDVQATVEAKAGIRGGLLHEAAAAAQGKGDAARGSEGSESGVTYVAFDTNM